MSAAGQSASSEGGFLSSLLGHLPAGWQERLNELLEFDPTQLDWLGEESTRVGANLLLLLEQGWPEMLALGGRLVVFALGGALVVGVAAAFLAEALYLIAAGPLLRKGWKTGRLLGCFAAAVVAFLAAAGGGWAGLWLGAGRALEQAIEEEFLVERIAAATFLAFSLDEGENPQGVDPDAVEELLERAQRRSTESWGDFRARAEAAAAEAGLEEPGWLRADLLVDTVERLGGGGVPSLVALHEVLSGPAVADGADPLPQTAGIRKRAVSAIRANVYPQAAASLGIGLGMPLIGLVLFGLLGCFVNRGSAIDQQGAG